MLKINQDKLVQDYKALVEKQAQGYAADEAALRAFGHSQGYSEKYIEALLEFSKEKRKGGLSVIELHKLEHLAEYVEEVVDTDESELEAAVTESETVTATNF